MQQNVEQLLQRILQQVSTEQLKLPSLPDIALQVKACCDDDQADSASVAEVISQDPAITARLMQLANSAFYQTRQQVDSLSTAITRLGLRMVRDLAVTLAMRQLYQAPNDILQERLQELWLAGVKTAALARTLSRPQGGLDAEQAMIAGLLHNIGALPVLLQAAADEQIIEDPALLAQVIHCCQGKVGAYMFRHWQFPEYMIDIALYCYDFERRHPGSADYLDIVQAALVEGSIFTGLECPQDWSSIPAFDKLHIDTDVHVLEIEDNRLMFEETQSVLI